MPLTPSADRLAGRWPAAPAADLPTLAEALPLPTEMLESPPMTETDAADPRCLLTILLDDGTVFEVEAATAAKAREMVAQTLRAGHTHVEGDTAEIFPPHRIQKITVQGPGFAQRQAPHARIA